jgi:hypothetical protein
MNGIFTIMKFLFMSRNNCKISFLAVVFKAYIFIIFSKFLIIKSFVLFLDNLVKHSGKT